MADYESLLTDIIEEHGKSRRALWAVAEGVWRLYQDYARHESDFVAILCNELAVGPDTIRHFRFAWALRLGLEAIPGFKLGRLSISHIYTAVDFVGRLGIEVLAEWLGVAEAERWSTRRLAAELSTACNDSGTLGWLHSRLALESGRLIRLYGASEQAGLDDELRVKLSMAIELIEEVIKTKIPR